ncbi:hypothetical protein CEUSTIGMA_g3653.t1 [Chlamydomonas eustigma]|uniref:Uncharacterized protein n=1 Tax=Chlamydomonas eustigma TaxID=1157962 RepID=A0A250WZU0_9CHLO|nr:hypothetical protein CEUSTIGMA_g3653.t1 [Chlamydomonas eustigma]|eukprot:GAX76209.1 hypothetical protein CEUSTIGMA_g3653.t1 [Chlamydomonas eustigma]
MFCQGLQQSGVEDNVEPSQLPLMYCGVTELRAMDKPGLVKYDEHVTALHDDPPALHILSTEDCVMILDAEEDHSSLLQEPSSMCTAATAHDSCPASLHHPGSDSALPSSDLNCLLALMLPGDLVKSKQTLVAAGCHSSDSSRLSLETLQASNQLVRQPLIPKLSVRHIKNKCNSTCNLLTTEGVSEAVRTDLPCEMDVVQGFRVQHGVEDEIESSESSQDHALMMQTELHETGHHLVRSNAALFPAAADAAATGAVRKIPMIARRNVRQGCASQLDFKDAGFEPPLDHVNPVNYNSKAPHVMHLETMKTPPIARNTRSNESVAVGHLTLSSNSVFPPVIAAGSLIHDPEVRQSSGAAKPLNKISSFNALTSALSPLLEPRMFRPSVVALPLTCFQHTHLWMMRIMNQSTLAGQGSLVYPSSTQYNEAGSFRTRSGNQCEDGAELSGHEKLGRSNAAASKSGKGSIVLRCRPVRNPDLLLRPLPLLRPQTSQCSHPGAHYLLKKGDTDYDRNDDSSDECLAAEPCATIMQPAQATASAIFTNLRSGEGDGKKHCEETRSALLIQLLQALVGEEAAEACGRWPPSREEESGTMIRAAMSAAAGTDCLMACELPYNHPEYTPQQLVGGCQVVVETEDEFDLPEEFWDAVDKKAAEVKAKTMGAFKAETAAAASACTEVPKTLPRSLQQEEPLAAAPVHMPDMWEAALSTVQESDEDDALFYEAAEKAERAVALANTANRVDTSLPPSDSIRRWTGGISAISALDHLNSINKPCFLMTSCGPEADAGTNPSSYHHEQQNDVCHLMEATASKKSNTDMKQVSLCAHIAHRVYLNPPSLLSKVRTKCYENCNEDTVAHAADIREVISHTYESAVCQEDESHDCEGSLSSRGVFSRLLSQMGVLQTGSAPGNESKDKQDSAATSLELISSNKLLTSPPLGRVAPCRQPYDMQGVTKPSDEVSTAVLCSSLGMHQSNSRPESKEVEEEADVIIVDCADDIDIQEWGQNEKESLEYSFAACPDVFLQSLNGSYEACPITAPLYNGSYEACPITAPLYNATSYNGLPSKGFDKPAMPQITLLRPSLESNGFYRMNQASSHALGLHGDVAQHAKPYKPKEVQPQVPHPYLPEMHAIGSRRKAYFSNALEGHSADELQHIREGQDMTAAGVHRGHLSPPKRGMLIMEVEVEDNSVSVIDFTNDEIFDDDEEDGQKTDVDSIGLDNSHSCTRLDLLSASSAVLNTLESTTGKAPCLESHDRHVKDVNDKTEKQCSLHIQKTIHSQALNNDVVVSSGAAKLVRRWDQGDNGQEQSGYQETAILNESVALDGRVTLLGSEDHKGSSLQQYDEGTTIIDELDWESGCLIISQDSSDWEQPPDSIHQELLHDNQRHSCLENQKSVETSVSLGMQNPSVLDVNCLNMNRIASSDKSQKELIRKRLIQEVFQAQKRGRVDLSALISVMSENVKLQLQDKALLKIDDDLSEPDIGRSGSSRVGPLLKRQRLQACLSGNNRADSCLMLRVKRVTSMQQLLDAAMKDTRLMESRSVSPHRLFLAMLAMAHQNNSAMLNLSRARADEIQETVFADLKVGRIWLPEPGWMRLLQRVSSQVNVQDCTAGVDVGAALLKKNNCHENVSYEVCLEVEMSS